MNVALEVDVHEALISLVGDADLDKEYESIVTDRCCEKDGDDEPVGLGRLLDFVMFEENVLDVDIDTLRIVRVSSFVSDSDSLIVSLSVG